MASDRVHKLSFLQIAKTLLRFGRKTKTIGSDEEPARKHKDLRKTLSLSSSCIGSTHGYWFGPDLAGQTSVEDVEKVPLFKTSNAFNPKYYSQKSRSGGDTNTVAYFLSKPNETIKQPAEKLG